jgi:hypothetical protein
MIYKLLRQRHLHELNCLHYIKAYLPILLRECDRLCEVMRVLSNFHHHLLCRHLPRSNEWDVSFSQVSHNIKIAGVMRSHCEVSWIAINDWRTHLGVRVHSTVNTIPYS